MKFLFQDPFKLKMVQVKWEAAQRLMIQEIFSDVSAYILNIYDIQGTNFEFLYLNLTVRGFVNVVVHVIQLLNLYG